LINCQRIFKLQRTWSNTYNEFYDFSKGTIDVSIRFRNVSATSAIKRPFAVQIITDASDVRLFFFHGRRILDCALISVVRLIRDDAFWDFRTLYYKKGPTLRPMDGRCHACCFFALVSSRVS